MLVIKRDKDQLINMIENETNIDNPNLYANLKIYILSAMNESEGINHVDINLKKQVATCMIEFINKSINKGYLNTDNYKDSLKRIIQSCEKFYDITDKTTYGNNSTRSFGFNFSSSYFLSHMEHVVFHEMTHSISNLYSQDIKVMDIEREYDNNSIRMNNNQYSEEINIKNPNQIQNKVITFNMIQFLDEIMAESTACDLLNDYRDNKESIGAGFSSDWIILYNRSYQKLGYLFLQTLYDDIHDERDLFKTFTKQAISNNQEVCTYIQNIYRSKNSNNWKEDLNKISNILGEVLELHQIDDRKAQEAIDLMKKYTGKRMRIINKRINIKKR